MSIALHRRPARTIVAVLAALVVTPAAASAAPSAAPIPVTGQATAVAPDPGLVAGIKSLGASVKGVGATTVDGQGRFVFPVTGGYLTPALKGKVNHTGGLELKSKYGIRFGIRSFVIDTTGSPTLTAEPTIGGFGLGIRVPVASITGLAVTTDAPATVVTGTLKLTSVGAGFLNTFLTTNVLKQGTVFGVAQARVTLAG